MIVSINYNWYTLGLSYPLVLVTEGLPEANLSASASLNKDEGKPIWLRASVSFPLSGLDELRTMENERPLNSIISTTTIDISVLSVQKWKKINQ